MLLFLKNLVFTILVPGTVAIYVPYAIGARAIMVSSVSAGHVAFEIRWRVRAGRRLDPLTVEFWNALMAGA